MDKLNSVDKEEVVLRLCNVIKEIDHIDNQFTSILPIELALYRKELLTCIRKFDLTCQPILKDSNLSKVRRVLIIQMLRKKVCEVDDLIKENEEIGKSIRKHQDSLSNYIKSL